ncbi:hypothetical protein [Streptomyces sp. PTD5-9]
MSQGNPETSPVLGGRSVDVANRAIGRVVLDALFLKELKPGT